MRHFIRPSVLAIALAMLCLFPSVSHAWGRHDVITRLVLDTPEFSRLEKLRVDPEPIEAAAPDLLKRVIPELEQWCLRYHRDHDRRYRWKIPEENPVFPGVPKLDARQELLWMLEDNIETPLDTGGEKSAAEILVRYVDEPDGPMDGGLNRSPYIERVRDSISLYYQEGNEHTHTFRHYYVPRSLVPPFLTPRGIAPYRAALYSHLASGAFAAGHPYWGFRFLAWALHYTQDVTQPWHTVLLPGLSFLRFSKVEMKHEISALHYLTEAFTDSWMEKSLSPRPARVLASPAAPTTAAPAVARPAQSLAESLRSLPDSVADLWRRHKDDPWYDAEVVEELAKASHSVAGDLGGENRDVFTPVVNQLNEKLKPTSPVISWGGEGFRSSMLDFEGNGAGATEFLAPIWGAGFGMARARDRMLRLVARQIDEAIGASRLLVLKVLERAAPAECGSPRPFRS